MLCGNDYLLVFQIRCVSLFVFVLQPVQVWVSLLALHQPFQVVVSLGLDVRTSGGGDKMDWWWSRDLRLHYLDFVEEECVKREPTGLCRGSIVLDHSILKVRRAQWFDLS